MIIEKDNVFYCDCGFSFERGRSGTHDCGTGLRKKLAESQREFRAADATIENLQMQVEKLAAELSVVEAIHNEAVFITDEHYEQCPPEVQKMIRSLAVLQIPAYQTFLAEMRASGVEMLANFCATANNGYEIHPDIEDMRGFAAQLRNQSIPSPAPLSSAITDIIAERHRQKTVEGWTPEHDDQYEDGELVDAAACYAQDSSLWDCVGEPPCDWPWPDGWWKPSNDMRRNLIKAGALILAEIERRDRAAGTAKGE